MEEIWKDIKGYENIYQISNKGNVKSLGNNKTKKEKILKPSVDKGGYMFICLHKNGVKKKYLVHRLVAEAFYGRIPQGMQVNHINEIKSDNRLENLNLMTPKENCNWGTAIQRRTEKTTNGKCSKPVLKIDPISNEIVAEFPSVSEVQRQLGIRISFISKCCNNKPHHNTAGSFKWQFKSTT